MDHTSVIEPPHTPTTTISQEAPYTRARIVISMNEDHARKFHEAGIRIEYRTQADKDALAAKHIAEAQARGINPFRLGRKDSTGKPVPDGGIQAFGKEGLKCASLRELRTDFEASGLEHMDVRLYRDEGRVDYCLELTFERGARMELAPEALELVNRLLQRIFAAIHVWVNPDGSTNVRPVKYLPNGQANAQALRMDLEGNYRSEPLVEN